MAVIVAILGVLIVAIGLVGLIQPGRLIGMIEYWPGPIRFRLAIVVRLVLGCLLLFVAAACRYPLLVRAIGVLSIVAAVVILIVGQRRLDLFIGWWLTRSPAVIRVSALFALAFGVLLIYAGV